MLPNALSHCLNDRTEYGVIGVIGQLPRRGRRRPSYLYSMTLPTVKGEARERILLAAEELMAKHGVDGVSARSINAAAGVSAGILHYHFGGLDKVVDALLERHMMPLMAQRRAMYDSLQAQPQVTLRAVVEILVIPLARKIIEEGSAGARYVQFLARLHTDRNPKIARIFEQSFGGNSSALVEMLQRILPEIPMRVLWLRLIVCSHAMLQSLAEISARSQLPIPPGNPPREQVLWDQVEILIEFLCGGLAAPTNLHS